jgi:hypothetical protein
MQKYDLLILNTVLSDLLFVILPTRKQNAEASRINIFYIHRFNYWVVIVGFIFCKLQI